MFIHSVYFSLRPDLSPADKGRFVAGLESLVAIESVRYGHFGTPASTDRPVIDRGYSYGLVLFFRDLAAHDAYQVDPVHDRFRADCSPFWTQVRIFDTVTSDDA